MANFSEKTINSVIEISNDDILPNRFQPRKHFDEKETLELATSIKEHGLLQPIVVRRIGNKYEIIYGERRFKANLLAGNDTITAIVNEFNDKESSEVSIIENIQRQGLNPIEEAISYKRRLDMGDITQEELAKKVGKSQSALANKLRLLNASDNVQDALMDKKISERHARSLLKLKSLKDQDILLERIIKERLTVRKTDEEIEKMNNNEINNLNQPINDMTSPIMGNIMPNNSEIQMNDNTISAQNPVVSNPFVNNEEVSQPQTDIPLTPDNNSVETTTVPLNNSVITPQPEINQLNQNNLGNTSIINDTPIVESSEPNLQNVDSIGSINNGNINSEVNLNPIENINNDILMPNNQDNNQININSIPTPIDELINSNPVMLDQPIGKPSPSSNLDIFNNTDTLLNSNIQSQPVVENEVPVNQDVPVLDTSFLDNVLPQQQNVEPVVTEPVNDLPSFIPEQPVETNIGIVTPVVDLNQNIQQPQQQPVQDLPLNPINTQPEVMNPTEPIIVPPTETQYDPIMPQDTNVAPNIDFKTIINLIRQCSDTIEKCGYKIDSEEYDLGNNYQIVFKIEK